MINKENERSFICTTWSSDICSRFFNSYSLIEMKRKTDYATLVHLIEQYRKGQGKFLTALDYYIDFCENRHIYDYTGNFTKVVVSGTDKQLEKRMKIYVEDAISYYD